MEQSGAVMARPEHGTGLVSLSIDNYASIRHLEIELGPGLTVIAGRDGCGNTDILDALRLYHGGADVRDGQRPDETRPSRITAGFEMHDRVLRVTRSFDGSSGDPQVSATYLHDDGPGTGADQSNIPEFACKVLEHPPHGTESETVRKITDAPARAILLAYEPPARMIYGGLQRLAGHGPVICTTSSTDLIPRIPIDSLRVLHKGQDTPYAVQNGRDTCGPPGIIPDRQALRIIAPALVADAAILVAGAGDKQILDAVMPGAKERLGIPAGFSIAVIDCHHKRVLGEMLWYVRSFGVPSYVVWSRDVSLVARLHRLSAAAGPDAPYHASEHDRAVRTNKMLDESLGGTGLPDSGFSIQEKHACFADGIAHTGKGHGPYGTYPDAATCAERMVQRKDGRLDPLIGRAAAMVPPVLEAVAA